MTASTVVKQHHFDQKPLRGFTRWSKSHTAVVQQYFSDWIENTDRGGLPAKADIQKFLECNPDIQYQWTIVRNKVLNEKMAYAKRKKIVLDELEV